MAGRGIEVDHLSVHRWVIKLLPVFEKAFRRRRRPAGMSWRVDETYVRFDFLLRVHRDKAAARRYFEKSD